jgi:rare lipoprotein A
VTWQDLIGTQIAGRYTVRALHYASSHQSEFLAISADGDVPVSVALVEPEPGEAHLELAAINQARKLRHPNLIQIFDAGEYVFEGVPLLFIVAESAKTTLARTLESGPLGAPLNLLDDLLTALEWLHAQGLVFRNLGLDTVVRAGGRWKLSDLSQLHPTGDFAPSSATGRSVPPEANTGSITPAWDVWALGVLLQDALTSQNGKLPVPFDAIVAGCLEPDPGKRLSLAEIRRMLKSEPIPIPKLPPLPTPRVNDAEHASTYLRLTPIAVGAGVLLLIVLLFAYLRRDHKPTAPAADLPAAAPAVTPAPPPAAAAAPKASLPKSSAQKSPPQNSVLPPAVAQAKPSAVGPAQHLGTADYFSDDLNGKPTASGEKFNNQAMTAASRVFPIGTHVRVTNLQNGHHVVVRINDRGPHRSVFIISVTRHAADQLGFSKAGSARVKVEAVK